MSASNDAWRVAFSKITKTECGHCAVAFLKATVAYYKSLAITVLRVMRSATLPPDNPLSAFTPHQ